MQVSVTGPDGAEVIDGLRRAGDTLDLSGAGDGAHTISTTPRDACGTGETTTRTVHVDNTAPVLEVTSPTVLQHDTDDALPFTWTAVDAGAGTATSTGTFDEIAQEQGWTIDMLTLQPGEHTVAVSAEDFLGNAGGISHTFRVRAAAESLVGNLDRAWAEKLVRKADVYRGLRDSLTAAQQSHNKGKHSTEVNQLNAFANKLLAQRGKSVDVATADRLLAYVRDLVAAGG